MSSPKIKKEIKIIQVADPSLPLIEAYPMLATILKTVLRLEKDDDPLVSERGKELHEKINTSIKNVPKGCKIQWVVRDGSFNCVYFTK